jgi:hypothetical protein
MMVWRRANPPGLYKWLNARWMLRADAPLSRPADAPKLDRLGGATRPPRMPFAPVKEPVALPQLNIVTEYYFVATKRQMPPANQTKNRSP